EQRIGFPFLPFTSQLIQTLSSSTSKAQEVYASMPVRLVGKWADTRHESRAFILKQNLRFTAGYFVNRPETLIGYLQPHPIQYRNLLTVSPPGIPAERTLVEDSIRSLARLPFDEYDKRMKKMFTDYGKVFEDLSQEYAAYSNIKFYDIR